jgi:hypothetical protein
MSRKENPAAFARGGAVHDAQLGGFEHFHTMAAKAEFQRAEKVLHLEALSLSGGSQFSGQALSADFRHRSVACQ